MRIICKRPAMDLEDGTLGVAAYDLACFRHHPTENNPAIICTLLSGQRLRFTWRGRDTNNVLGQIAEALLSSSGVADCRNIPNLQVDMLKDPATHVVIDHRWANTVYPLDEERQCLAVATVK